MGTLAVISLVALRLGIGWHFFQEGAAKIPDPSWTAAYFFTGSKGPLKPLFESMVWDVDGRVRLNYVETEGGWPAIDLDQTTQIWDQYRVQVGEHYGFDEKQKAEAAESLASWEGQLAWYFDRAPGQDLGVFPWIGASQRESPGCGPAGCRVVARPSREDRVRTGRCAELRGWRR